MLIKDKFHTRTSHSLITPSVSDSFVAVLPNLSNAARLWECRGAEKIASSPPPSQPIHHPQSELGRDISLIGDRNESSRLQGRWSVWGRQDMRLQFESYYGACPSLSGSRLRTSHACNIRMGGRGQEKVFFFFLENHEWESVFFHFSASSRHIKDKWLWTGTDGKRSSCYCKNGS